MTTTVKTAISIRKELFCEVNRLAKELQISRSKLFALAASDFIKKNENKKILSKINAAFSDHPEAEEINLQHAMRLKQAGNLEREPW